MKKWLLIIFIIATPITASINSCKQIVDKTSQSFEEITINPKEISNKKYFSISEISNEVEYIPLETSKDVIFGEITQIEYCDGRYNIFDGIGKSIFIFDSKGKFLSKISNVGKGPGEYISIRGFSIDESQVYIHDDRRQRIFVYDSLGNYLYEDKTTLIFTDFFFINKELAYLYLRTFDNSDRLITDSPNQYRLVFRKNGNIINKLLPFNYDEKLRQYTEIRTHFSCFNDTISFIDGIDNFVYRINKEGEISKRFYINFDEYYFSMENRINFPGKKKSLLQSLKILKVNFT